MGGLGNGRRGGRSPPLMIGALIACILVLGFNYWVSSSRNLELQTKLYELEGQVRRGAAERGVVEMKKNEFQEEIQRQKEQISHIESLYKRQLEGSQNTCSQEKGTLQQNISSSTKTIQELKGQTNQLSDDLGKLQKELQGCQGNIKTLNNKLTYDMTHCQSQVLSQKELCDERVAAVKLEVQKKMEKLITPSGVSSQENAVDGTAKADGAGVMAGVDAVKTSTVVSHTPSLSQPKENDLPELLTNEIIVDKGEDAPADLLPEEDLSKVEHQSVPSAAAVKQDILLPPEEALETEEGEAETSEPFKNNLTEDKDMEVMDAREEGAQTEEADPGMEGMLISRVKADETPNGLKLEEPDEYDADEQVVGGVDLEKQQHSKLAENIDKDMEEELADYNGDDENEGEFEADKQAELARI
ncbi:Golgi membrane protein 1 [Sebastes umbrosus]|uniref:Golgi membrane protein 1 n=1 Tax=Sebastes umbrosus TaxID=72105 RepID=UPI00189E6B95|nr:Golgi membrane protein 1 [Sebastes umbrosus]XP_037633995.1 Golgi membrane protein 1 [Sebastes umbrosus]XP_037633996.1 Golgi membrane protein 1 [Sebastes umbrosus]XP_037633997.1 Golgi membrane protein 1 [Sebastes umbrosus]